MWEKTKEIAEQYAREVIELYRQKLRENPKGKYGDKNTTGNLSNNLRYEVNITNDSLEVYLYLEDYYKWVEQGRAPYGKNKNDSGGDGLPSNKYPPIDVIQTWINNKPSIDRKDGDGKLPTTKQLAFLIARSIAENGIEPTYYLSDTIEELQDKYIPLLEDALAEDAANFALIMFDEIHL